MMMFAEGFTELAAEKGEIGEVFHFATPENISIRALVEKIADRLEICFDDNVKVTGERLGKDEAYLLIVAWLKEDLVGSLLSLWMKAWIEQLHGYKKI